MDSRQNKRDKDVAEEILVNLSGTSVEAMRAGTIVAGFDSVGGQGMLVGEGEGRNCVLAETGDYFRLAQRLEPLLLDIITGDLSSWSLLIRNGRRFAAPHTPEAEEKSVLEFWRGVLGECAIGKEGHVPQA